MTTLQEALKSRFPELPEPEGPRCSVCGVTAGVIRGGRLVELREMDTGDDIRKVRLCRACFGLGE